MYAKPEGHLSSTICSWRLVRVLHADIRQRLEESSGHSRPQAWFKWAHRTGSCGLLAIWYSCNNYPTYNPRCFGKTLPQSRHPNFHQPSPPWSKSMGTGAFDDIRGNLTSFALTEETPSDSYWPGYPRRISVWGCSNARMLSELLLSGPHAISFPLPWSIPWFCEHKTLWPARLGSRVSYWILSGSKRGLDANNLPYCQCPASYLVHHIQQGRNARGDHHLQPNWGEVCARRRNQPMEIGVSDSWAYGICGEQCLLLQSVLLHNFSKECMSLFCTIKSWSPGHWVL